MSFLFNKHHKTTPELQENEMDTMDTKETSTIQRTDVDEELIAVITAAVAASLNQSTYNLRVKSFRRIGQSSPVWNTVGRQEIIENKL